jgi:sirohydrochlorin cobaltochelatase
VPISSTADLVVSSNHLDSAQIPDLPPLTLQRPLLMIGHGTRDEQGRQCFLDFAAEYHRLDPSRPVFPCFLELTSPSIQEVVDQCVAEGYTDLSALPILLFAARHNKFDVTNELDIARQRHPQITYHYGRHFGITPSILDLWKARLELLDTPAYNPHNIPRSETILLVVGRGASDPDANGDVFKLARILWEGSEYKTVEICFIGITHPRLEEGFRRARLYEPKRVIVLPHFLFTGVLVQKIYDVAAQQQTLYPNAEIVCLPEMGMHPQLFGLVRDREIETQLGQVNMNCELCKFRLAALNGKPAQPHSHGHDHSHDHDHPHSHGHGHHHGGPNLNDEAAYHDRIWQVP